MLEAQGYGAGFVEDHLVPMCSALWSVSALDILDAPAREVIRFMAHHRMLQFGGRPEWRVISNGAQRYVAAFESGFRGSIRRGTPVTSIKRGVNGVVVRLAEESEVFDAAVLACHSDQALSLLADPSREEREVLGAIGFSSNRVVLHSDASVMPRRRKAWSSWNALVGEPGSLNCQVTYWMNCLQELGDAQQFFVTLNPVTPLSAVWSERVYAHPRFDRKSDLARNRRDEISGVRRTYYCGAYWGWGFHEEGFTSGLDVARQIRGAIRVAA
jgi:predicted NAD/FAD-binding protein